MAKAKITLIRWSATVRYRAAAGTFSITHEMGELYELHGLVERSHPWWAIDGIDVRFIGTVPVEAQAHTLEEARAL